MVFSSSSPWYPLEHDDAVPVVVGGRGPTARRVYHEKREVRKNETGTSFSHSGIWLVISVENLIFIVVIIIIPMPLRNESLREELRSQSTTAILASSRAKQWSFLCISIPSLVYPPQMAEAKDTLSPCPSVG